MYPKRIHRLKISRSIEWAMIIVVYVCVCSDSLVQFLYQKLLELVCTCALHANNDINMGKMIYKHFLFEFEFIRPIFLKKYEDSSYKRRVETKEKKIPIHLTSSTFFLLLLLLSVGWFCPIVANTYNFSASLTLY